MLSGLDAASITPITVHQYATRIYRKCGVKGRTECHVLWLRELL